MSIARLLNLLSFAAYAAVIVASALYLYRNSQELGVLKEKEAAVEERLQRVQAEVKERQADLDRLRSDPLFIERTIRARLNYAKEDEIIFRFE